MIAVLAEAADANIKVDGGALVDHAERNGRRRAVLVADELLRVEVVDALILGRFAAEGETLADVAENVADAVAELAREDARLGGGIIEELARLGADLHDLALLDDEHTLAVRHGDHRAVGDDVLVALVVARTARDLLVALGRQNVCGHRFTVEVFLPLVGHHAACGPRDRFDESHTIKLPSVSFSRFCLYLLAMHPVYQKIDKNAMTFCAFLHAFIIRQQKRRLYF